jgi:hypothetical protein
MLENGFLNEINNNAYGGYISELLDLVTILNSDVSSTERYFVLPTNPSISGGKKYKTNNKKSCKKVKNSKKKYKKYNKNKSFKKK